MKKTAGHGLTAKHTASKHAAASKHHPKGKAKAPKVASTSVHVAAKSATGAKPRKWSPDGDVALCSARAVAQSLQIALGRTVSHDDVLALYWLVADDADTGASILATLQAAQEYGLAGHRPLSIGLLPDRVNGSCTARLAVPDTEWVPAASREDALHRSRAHHRAYAVSVLGVDWLQPHAVAVGPDGAWWSWGEPHSPADFPGAVIEEAWAVSWL